MLAFVTMLLKLRLASVISALNKVRIDHRAAALP